MITESKVCRTCAEPLPLSDFTVHGYKNGKTHYRADCNPCRGKKRRAAYDPEQAKNISLKSLYGVTLEDYDRMAEAQGHKCAICHSTDPRGNGSRFAVDHDHKTGKVRGLLCGPCNMGIGKLGDDIALLTAAIEYLKDHADV